MSEEIENLVTLKVRESDREWVRDEQARIRQSGKPEPSHAELFRLLRRAYEGKVLPTNAGVANQHAEFPKNITCPACKSPISIAPDGTVRASEVMGPISVPLEQTEAQNRTTRVASNWEKEVASAAAGAAGVRSPTWRAVLEGILPLLQKAAETAEQEREADDSDLPERGDDPGAKEPRGSRGDTGKATGRGKRKAS